MKKEYTRLPDAELEVMQVLWQNQPPMGTSEILEILNQFKNWNISTLQTLLSRLVTRGFIQSKKQGKNNFYTPLVEEESYLASENKSFLDRLNQSSLTKFVSTLMQSNSVSKEDLQELKEFIEKQSEEE
ncbi:BlaI/MecI/CopY family transcriptional regulator [Paludicola sp. MB14-C6]|uniref:BlaI/MecI/CopY family transcriptional regulator n=1 Tax=Paludihabitans sp. MB14-C6 TaxID=3070656 RepID=UPI0027DD7A1C|nr:BlaI/MecI/CopY family transcriptional regulator [Paludicola sp. MB14-C6]WMJ22340.1 BlaI/MecI/CopY family transcriptional regulator [Paludicola sp. MB14-C6]